MFSKITEEEIEGKLPSENEIVRTRLQIKDGEWTGYHELVEDEE